MSEITDRIKELMQNSELTAYKVCKDCSISDGHFADVMKYYPKRNFTVEQLAKLSKYFGVTTDWLIWGDEKDRDKEIELLNEKINRLEKLQRHSVEAFQLFSEIENQIEKFKTIRMDMLKDTTIKGYSDEWSKAMRDAFAKSMHLQEDLINRKK